MHPFLCWISIILDGNTWCCAYFVTATHKWNRVSLPCACRAITKHNIYGELGLLCHFAVKSLRLVVIDGCKIQPLQTDILVKKTAIIKVIIFEEKWYDRFSQDIFCDNITACCTLSFDEWRCCCLASYHILKCSLHVMWNGVLYWGVIMP